MRTDVTAAVGCLSDGLTADRVWTEDATGHRSAVMHLFNEWRPQTLSNLPNDRPTTESNFLSRWLVGAFTAVVSGARIMASSSANHHARPALCLASRFTVVSYMANWFRCVMAIQTGQTGRQTDSS